MSKIKDSMNRKFSIILFFLLSSSFANKKLASFIIVRKYEYSYIDRKSIKPYQFYQNSKNLIKIIGIIRSPSYNRFW